MLLIIMPEHDFVRLSDLICNKATFCASSGEIVSLSDEIFDALILEMTLSILLHGKSGQSTSIWLEFWHETVKSNPTTKQSKKVLILSDIKHAFVFSAVLEGDCQDVMSCLSGYREQCGSSGLGIDSAFKPLAVGHISDINCHVSYISNDFSHGYYLFRYKCM